MTRKQGEKPFKKTVAGVPLKFEPATGGWSASGGDVTVGRARTRTLITDVFVRHSTQEQVIELARELIRKAVRTGATAGDPNSRGYVHARRVDAKR